jgi:pimeloyl-ACP methyl ester carboxylesterase
VINFADNNELATFTLVGYCLGGRVAMHTAGLFPDRVESIVVLEASLGPFDFPICDKLMKGVLAVSS